MAITEYYKARKSRIQNQGDFFKLLQDSNDGATKICQVDCETAIYHVQNATARINIKDEVMITAVDRLEVDDAKSHLEEITGFRLVPLARNRN